MWVIGWICPSCGTREFCNSTSCSVFHFCSPRPPRFAECEAHWGHTRQLAASLGAAAQAEPPRVLPALCQAAAENDRPQTDCDGTRAAAASDKENRDGHEPPPAPPGDLQGPVLAQESRSLTATFAFSRLHYYFEGENLTPKKITVKKHLKKEKVLE